MKPEDIKPWKIKRSEYLVKRPWLTARRDVVELPDGREIPEYYVLEYPDWVNVIAIDKAGRFIMEKQYRHGMQRMSYELPCGVMETKHRLRRRNASCLKRRGILAANGSC